MTAFSGTKSVDPAILAFFKNPDASSVVSLKASQIAAPIVRGEDVQPVELMRGGGLRIAYFIKDRSPSMEDVGDLLREEFNTAFVPAIKDARGDDIAALRIGGLSFSSDITPIWQKKDGQEVISFHALENLPEITVAEYDPSKGHGTNLDEAIEQGTAIAVRYAADQQAKIGSPPDIDIFVLTDGRDTHRPDHDGVKAMIQSRNKGRVRFVCFYFETEGGLPGTQDEIKAQLVELYGFDSENVVVFAKGPNETDEERAHRFRAMVRVMSRVSASKGTSAVQAAAANSANNQSQEEDEDLV